ncbi:MAG: bifunctional phosphoribosylaminoimidazolecarboxamide formyltransferase/IMP cyclohydrolase [Candidatus Eisenbacteria bacterium]
MGKIETALISVADKSDLIEFARGLSGLGVRILATGGTGRHLKEQGIEAADISSVTGKVEFLGGLVKTLHTAIHAGILAGRDNASHMEELASLGWQKIDMVVVNFYPLKEGTEKRDLSFIDIGGPAMARAAAKNFRSCVPVPAPSWYSRVLDEIKKAGEIGEDLRWALATDVLARTGGYDARTLAAVPGSPERGATPDSLLVGAAKAIDLRYGENPHQQAAFYFPGNDPGFDVIKGALSYNNLLDVDCCLDQLAEFEGRAAVVVKHVGPCGTAEAETGPDALESAYACDPLSAFGGVIGVSFTFDDECAALLAKRFVECIVAPKFEEQALERLRKKKRTRLVVSRARRREPLVLRTALGGILAQARDDVLVAGDLKFVTGETPPQPVIDDLIFAWKTVKHVKSNAIVFARSKRTLGIGAGQPSRVDATKIAIRKAGEAGHDLEGGVMASDGFFPFPDCIELAAEAGARAAVQPGGSIRDEEVIERAKALGITMALTSTRHFRH